ncbi:prolactin-like [Megalops cyprinoides]|uniref:prolactin-like n=1 Tax=Megalops cyprinoides TaxID=118141 RepID=UPI001863E008|nr:prolactin-like [Megalops cyprinoides]
MAQRLQDSKLLLRVAVLLCLSAWSHSVELPDLMDRAAELSENLHSLSTALKSDLDSHYPVVGKMMVPRHSQCHTSSIKTPYDKEQVLSMSESELISLIRSLLLSWSNPLLLLSLEAASLPHPLNTVVYSKANELQRNSDNLSAGLDILVRKMGVSLQSVSPPPLRESTLGNDDISRLVNFHFLMSCFRRDSHKIDNFLKILRCRTNKLQPGVC